MAVLSTLGYFMPIISFLFIFVVVYVLLEKVKIFENSLISVMLSFFLSAFVIFNASLVEFIRVSSAWVITFFICLFLIFMMVSFGGKDWDKILDKKFGMAVLAILILIFLFSSAHVFNWAVNWSTVTDWAGTSWFGFVLLLAIAALVSWVLMRKVSN